MSTSLTMIIKSTSTVYTILFMHVLFNNKLVYLELFSLYEHVQLRTILKVNTEFRQFSHPLNYRNLFS